jgi:hypothetical protein
MAAGEAVDFMVGIGVPMFLLMSGVALLFGNVRLCVAGIMTALAIALSSSFLPEMGGATAASVSTISHCTGGVF